MTIHNTITSTAHATRPAPAADDASVVVCENVSVTYGSGRAAVVAVHGVSVQVPAGSVVALTGPSGSGKSTLLHAMAGLVHPTSGRLTWPRWNGSPQGRPGLVGVIFQAPSLLPGLTAAENVALPMLLADTSDREATERAHQALADLGLEELGGQLPETLSGGQAQRVAVARALACRPSLILADEPTGQLDHPSAAKVVDLLIRASATLGAALVLSTHDQSMADRLPEQWTMRDGRLDVASTRKSSTPTLRAATS